MKQKLPIILTCQRAAEFCDKTEYHEMNLSGKLRLKFHLMFCQACRAYWKRNRKLSHLLEKADLRICTSEEKRRWQKQLEQEQARNESQ